MTKRKPQIKLQRGEQIIAVVPEYATGPGWANTPIWVYIASQGKLRTECIQPDKQTDEYRLCTPYWMKRLASPFGLYDRIVLTRGYPRRDDESRRLTLPWQGYTIKSITHPHFGPDPVTVYAIRVTADTDKKEQ